MILVIDLNVVVADAVLLTCGFGLGGVVCGCCCC